MIWNPIEIIAYENSKGSILFSSLMILESLKIRRVIKKTALLSAHLLSRASSLPPHKESNMINDGIKSKRIYELLGQEGCFLNTSLFYSFVWYVSHLVHNIKFKKVFVVEFKWPYCHYEESCIGNLVWICWVKKNLWLTWIHIFFQYFLFHWKEYGKCQVKIWKASLAQLWKRILGEKYFSEQFESCSARARIMTQPFKYSTTKCQWRGNGKEWPSAWDVMKISCCSPHKSSDGHILMAPVRQVNKHRGMVEITFDFLLFIQFLNKEMENGIMGHWDFEHENLMVICRKVRVQLDETQHSF